MVMASVAIGLPFDQQKPSIFDLISENQLNDLLPPTLHQIVRSLTERYPRYLLRIFNSFDELYALCALLLERHFLTTYSSSFTEHFYGLKRERVLHFKGGEALRAQAAAPELLRQSLKLKHRDIWKNLALLVILPYIKRKLDQDHSLYAPVEAIVLGPNYRPDEDLASKSTVRQRILYHYKWFLRKLYPSINAAYYLALLAFNLAYLFDYTKFSSPLLWLVGTRIRRMGQADYTALAAATAAVSAKTSTSTRQRSPSTSILHPVNLALIVQPQIQAGLRLLLPTSIFALKFLEWWHASDFSRQISKRLNADVALSPPILSSMSPRKDKSIQGVLSNEHESHEKTKQPVNRATPISTLTDLPIFTVPPPTPTTASLCPICVHPIQTPTSAQTGYVFCYGCIFRWIEGSHERQEQFMSGQNLASEGKVWSDDTLVAESNVVDTPINKVDEQAGRDSRDATAVESRDGKWESGKGRCAITGRRVLGGSAGLRRVMI